ncbi:MAG TPA: XRE family transcriptional regulator [Candidatus Flavonifractor intestinigallinarum]|uniref:XRE family transcriptional regulator n=2 Tax=Flavonifractor TaxID=946234 RepID=A0A9D2SB91_9FIRM|nr:XRE family transcriptional regulator [Candidatus Flavonifractor intestinigallinarum]
MDVMQIVENIQYYCDKKGVTPTVAGKESGAGKELVTNMKRKGTMPSVEKIRLFANYLGVTTSELLGEAVGSAPSGVRIPVLGTIPAGTPLDAIEDILDWEEIPAAWATGGRQYFGLRVRGDSMYPRYLDGDTVILKKETTCESGDDCAVLVNGSEATLKQVMIKGDGSLELRPTNPAYPPRTYSPAEIESIPVQIIGVVVELRRKIK